MPRTRHFPPPWIIERAESGWQVYDANGVLLAFVRSFEGLNLESEHLTLEEGRRIARGIARLPELLQDRH